MEKPVKKTLPGNIPVAASKKSTDNKLSKKPTSRHTYFLQQLIHPDYILFDWEFFSRELEFE